MEQNIYVRVIDSPELRRMGLEELAGARALVVEELTQPERRMKGFMVLLEKAYQNEFLWFIPQMSVAYE